MGPFSSNDAVLTSNYSQSLFDHNVPVSTSNYSSSLYTHNVRINNDPIPSTSRQFLVHDTPQFNIPHTTIHIPTTHHPAFRNDISTTCNTSQRHPASRAFTTLTLENDSYETLNQYLYRVNFEINNFINENISSRGGVKVYSSINIQ